MKILMINSVCGIKSTGRVCTDMAELLEKQGHECKIAYGRDTVPERYKKYAVRIGNDLDVKVHGVLTRLFDRHGYGSSAATKRFIKWVKEYDPDIIHLHNIHGYYINLKVLFNYLKKSGKQVVWTLHDCWSYTGHCAHFDYNGCTKWREGGCKSCPLTSEYPKSLTDGSERNYAHKKKLFTSVDSDKLTVIAPVRWSKGLIESSFLCKYKVILAPCGIDLDKFRHTESDFREKNGLEGKHVVLGVASTWDKMKGSEHINYLASHLPSDKYAVVTVGKDPSGNAFHSSVIRVQATDSIDELCGLYSTADVFVNPTLQETQGMTSIEAIACGTPVVMYNTGGAPEALTDKCGIVVERGDKEGLLLAVKKVCEDKPFTSEDAIKRSKNYDKWDCYQRVLDVYYDLLGEKND